MKLRLVLLEMNLDEFRPDFDNFGFLIKGNLNDIL